MASNASASSRNSSRRPGSRIRWESDPAAAVRVASLILLNGASDPSGDGKRETDGVSGPNMPNLDVVQSSFSQPAPADCHPSGTPCYRVKMTLNNLSLTPPGPPDADTDLVWLTQWFVPADPNCTQMNRSCTRGGKKFFVYAESTAGALVRCFSGENNAQFLGGGVTMTYPGRTQITAAGACSGASPSSRPGRRSSRMLSSALSGIVMASAVS